MREAILGLGCLLVLSGCPARVGSYAPRLDDTDWHREALEKRNCLECHDPVKIRYHGKGDDCTHCHILCRGC